MTLELTRGGYSAVVDPARGATILSIDWVHPSGDTLPLLAPLGRSGQGFNAGCFVMLPFANRIADGVFDFEGARYRLPVNEPAQGTAIHGLSRDHAWRTLQIAQATAVLEQEFEQPGNPYRYRARMDVELALEGVRIRLSVKNTGPMTMPFGMGLHPWFVKTPKALLTFEAEGTFSRDGRGLPVEPICKIPEFSTAPKPLGALPWFDGCFIGWRRTARLTWPESQASLIIEADGALDHLHVYVPDDRATVCAEPVSHAPDAIHRSNLPAESAMSPLAPGETLSGSMTLRAEATPPA
jgi:aldose 1-epimerase